MVLFGEEGLDDLCYEVEKSLWELGCGLLSAFEQVDLEEGLTAERFRGGLFNVAFILQHGLNRSLCHLNACGRANDNYRVKK